MIISLQDFGMEIPEEDKEFIFDRFHQEDYGGATGLCICKEIITKAVGKIWFESEIGNGTTFYLSLLINKKES